MTTTTDLAALLAGVDAGQDECLPLLADCLEEQGDPRASGLRRAMLPGWLGNTWASCVRPCQGADGGWKVPVEGFPCAGIVWPRLRGERRSLFNGHPYRWWPTRSAAYLALAEALSQEAPQ